MIHKKGIFLLLILLFIISAQIVSSEKVTLISESEQGFKLKFPEIGAIKQNQDYHFYFHIFNVSNGVPITEDVTCFFHLYNENGTHIYEAKPISTVDYNFDYEFYVSGNNFTSLGDYSYITQCNNSISGGFVSSFFTVTPDGKTQEGKQIPLLIAIAVISFILMYFGLKLNHEHFLLKLICVFFSFYSLVVIPAVFLSSVHSAALSLLKQTTSFIYLFWIYFTVYIIYFQFKKSERFINTIDKLKRKLGWRKNND